MLALYTAASKSAIELVVQISARTEGGGQDQPFLTTKRNADKALAASGLNHIILRPALVIGRNAHGGTALLRALAAMPVVLPLIHAQSPIETVSVDDVAAIVSAAIAGEFQSGTDIDLAAGEALTLPRTRRPSSKLARPPASAARADTGRIGKAGNASG